MLYSSAHKFIFNQVPRTGSSSTSLYLRPHCAPGFAPTGSACPEIISMEGIVGYSGDQSKLAVPPRFFVHMGLHDILHRLGKSTFDNSQKIANFRNPYSRIVSLRHVRERQGILAKTDKVSEIRSQIDEMDLELYGAQLKALTHIGGEFAIDCPIIQETYRDDIASLTESFELNPARVIPIPKAQANANSFIGHPPADLISESARDRIFESSAWIFERFGYSKHLDDALLPPACRAEANNPRHPATRKPDEMEQIP